MNESIETRLKSMYANKEILGYLCVNIPTEPLTVGWVDTAVISKGLSGSFRSKKNQKLFVLPLQNVVKVLLDRGIGKPGETGIVILGSPGLTSEKLVVIVRNMTTNENDGLIAICFRSKESNLHELNRIILKYIFKEPLTTEFLEPPIDYLESIKTDFDNGLVSEAFSLNFPSSKNLSRSWINDAIKGISKGNDILLLREGRLKRSSAIGLLFSNWILNNVDLTSHGKSTLSCFIVRNKILEVFIWDGARNIVSVCIYKDEKLEDVSRKILLPAWALSNEVIEPPLKTHDILISTTDKATRDISQIEPVSSSALLEKIKLFSTFMDAVDLGNIQSRLDTLESRVKESKILSYKIPNTGQLESRLKEAIERLESLSSRLMQLEKKIETLFRKQGV